MARACFSSLFLAVVLLACGGPKGAGPGASGGASGASAPQVSPPAGWVHIPPDSSVAPDTVAIYQGPAAEGPVAPSVEISRRELKAADRRRKPSHILTTLVTEMVQYFDGFEMIGAPEEVTLAGHSASRIKLKYTETLPDGASVDRLGRFYGVVMGGTLWIIRCMGSADGSAEADFDTIIDSLSF